MGSDLFDVGEPPSRDGYCGPRVEVPSCPPPAASSPVSFLQAPPAPAGLPVVPVVVPSEPAESSGADIRARSEDDRSAFRRAGGPGGLIAAAISVLLVASAAFALGGEPAGPAGSSGQSVSTPSAPETPPVASGLPDSGSKLGLGHGDLARISASVDPAVADITTTLAYGSGQAAGTGMVITPTGEVLTNNHVIDGATSISARIDGRGPTYKANLVATDPTADIALIQLAGASGLKTVSVGDSSSVRIGEPVVAIGNALNLPGAPKVTVGTITARNVPINAQESGTAICESLKGMFETDAPLEPGNSGGPLLDSDGQVVGIDTAASGSYDISGVQTAPATAGFAIPITTAIAVVTQMRDRDATSTVHIGPSPFLGVEVTFLPGSTPASSPCGNASSGNFGQLEPGASAPVDSGALVVGVEPRTPAAGAGIVDGDAITGFDGSPVSTPDALTRLVEAESPGDTARVSWVDLAGSTHEATVVLAAGPAD
jgi:S1-C subfamily serine protease